MSKKVKEQVIEPKKVKNEIQVVTNEIHLLIYQASKTEERILSSYHHKEDILFLINEFAKSQNLRDKYNIDNLDNLKIISTPLEANFGMELPSIGIRKKEIEKLFSEMESSIEESKITKVN
jgi:hypothetical protein